ncbi:Transposon Tf2-8 polyprotein [Portunus trituberculatus]|uniref:Transposon Tf2-8 polyprotein n=1 Tax=Portunus trituberculatus TaxID=210409 RepID=A0A5B7GEG2_PORTR|nr:Transposon Tf2-8 polyprotein [Portunus trituberculatus]
MRVDDVDHVSRYVSCTKHKGVTTGPAPIQGYPPPAQPWDLVSMDLLQLPKCCQGSQYLLVCVVHFSRFVILSAVKTKTALAIAHVLVTHLFCSYTTPRVLLSDNGKKFRNALLMEICAKYSIKPTFTVAYHPRSNGLVKREIRKILQALRHVVTSLHDNWDDWIPQVVV